LIVKSEIKKNCGKTKTFLQIVATQGNAKSEKNGEKANNEKTVSK